MSENSIVENHASKQPNTSHNSYKNKIKTDVCIVGAGAAGLFAAPIMAKNGLKVIILESASRPGRKLAISGGGHANFTNLNMGPDKFLAPPNNKFCIPALKALTPNMMIDFIKKAGFCVVEKKGGKLFLEEAAIELVKYLIEECRKNKVEIFFNERLHKLEADEKDFSLYTDKLFIQSSKVFLALGSPARPKLASCLYCWRLLSEMGHKVFPARPALTPLYYTKQNQDILRSLSGIGVNAKVTLRDAIGDLSERQWEDDLLFTHLGLSGPAILCASLYYMSESKLTINLLPGYEFEKILDSGGKSTPRSLLRAMLPPRLVDAILPSELASRKAAELSRKDRSLLGCIVNSWSIGDLKPAGLEMAEVCAGGVDLEQINPRTMESKLFKGLYIGGETQNVTGELGGYNLHWAFACAILAAQDINSTLFNRN